MYASPGEIPQASSSTSCKEVLAEPPPNPEAEYKKAQEIFSRLNVLIAAHLFTVNAHLAFGTPGDTVTALAWGKLHVFPTQTDVAVANAVRNGLLAYAQTLVGIDPLSLIGTDLGKMRSLLSFYIFDLNLDGNLDEADTALLDQALKNLSPVL